MRIQPRSGIYTMILDMTPADDSDRQIFVSPYVVTLLGYAHEFYFALDLYSP